MGVEESGILSNPDVQEKLLSLLPPNTSNKNKEAYLKEHLTSPQCLESIKTLQNALSGQSGNLQNILLNFQLDSSVLLDGAAGNPIEAFLESVVRSMKKEKEDGKEGEGKDDSKMEE